MRNWLTLLYGVKRWPFNGFAALVLYTILAGMNPAAAAEPRLILAFGDSLTAGYGLAPSEGFTAQLERALVKAGVDARVVNAGVSGDTSSGGRARLDWALAGLTRKPDLVILELGANDALRGIDPAITRANLDAMVAYLVKDEVPLLLAGMQAPPNLGKDYARSFNPIHAELAAKYQVALYPFFLDGVAAEPRLNQQDGIHPNADGVRVIVERLLPRLLPLLKMP